jgi:hypothetical protein
MQADERGANEAPEWLYNNRESDSPWNRERT